MKVVETDIQGCFIIYPSIFTDYRGSFIESFNLQRYIDQNIIDINTEFIQDNVSFSVSGTIRGLHFQKGKHAQAKLVTCLMGRVLDVIVDCRRSSPSFGKVLTYDIDSVAKQQIFIPRGCAHGFAVLSDSAYFMYKCDNYYNKESDSGIVYNDPNLKINWFVDNGLPLISDKDRNLPTWENCYKFE